MESPLGQIQGTISTCRGGALTSAELYLVVKGTGLAPVQGEGKTNPHS